ncbi:MAG: 5-oxoprolinase subunit PxpB [Phycisphaeraceae bacterium]|nr:5-oxoprolinase subunit PxpB [Phycisphaeraceae bacterium]
MHEAPVIAWVSECALRVAFARADPDHLYAVAAAISQTRLAGLMDVIPASESMLLVFDPALLDPARIEDRLRAVLAFDAAHQSSERREIMIPFCVCKGCAPDLTAVVSHAGCSADELLARFTEPTYQVGFLGFAPGFAYLRGLPESLAIPRRATPRIRVEAGSVAIGGGYAGIYPGPMPGGWWIIGRTSLVLFDPDRTCPAMLRPGDHIRFEPGLRSRPGVCDRASA